MCHRDVHAAREVRVVREPVELGGRDAVVEVPHDHVRPTASVGRRDDLGLGVAVDVTRRDIDAARERPEGREGTEQASVHLADGDVARYARTSRGDDLGREVSVDIAGRDANPRCPGRGLGVEPVEFLVRAREHLDVASAPLPVPVMNTGGWRLACRGNGCCRSDNG